MLRYFLLLLFFLPVSIQAQLQTELQGFEQLIGKTYKGNFIKEGKELPTYDVVSWERILNGKAVRAMHSVNDGAYGGETIFFFDKVSGKISYYYFTTAEHYTNGTIWFEGDTMISVEKVTGDEDGITEVKAITTFEKDGAMHVRSSYKKGDQWTDGHEIRYMPDASAVVKFK